MKWMGIVVLLFCSLLQAPLAWAADADVQERIRSLERQLEVLRQLKSGQDKAIALREDQCFQVFPSRAFCSCLSSRLPAEVTFDDYVKGVADGMPRSRELAVVRDACGVQSPP